MFKLALLGAVAAEGTLFLKQDQTEVTDKPNKITNVSKVCVNNDAGFVMNFHLRDL